MRFQTIFARTIIAASLLSLCAGNAVAQSGISLDQSFAQNGRLKVSGLQDPTCLVLADGRLLVASTNPNAVLLNMYKKDGTSDAGFGNGGNVSHAYSGLNPNFAQDPLMPKFFSYSMIQQADGKVLIMGTASHMEAGYSYSTLATFFIRVNLDGTLDQSFGTNGCVTRHYKYNTPGGACNTEHTKIMINADGKIVGVGTTNWDLNQYPLRREYKTIVWRLLPDGSPDVSFGQGGVCLGMFNSNDHFAMNAAIKDNGNIVVVGHKTLNGSYPGPYVDEITATGAAVFPVPFPNTKGAKSLAHAFVMLPGDVSYLTEGFDDIMYPSPVVIQKCEGNTFKVNITQYDFPPSAPSNPPDEFSKFYVTDMIAQGNDIIVCGFRRQSPIMPIPDAQDLCLLRLKNNGTLDAKFNNNSPYYLEPIKSFFSNTANSSREFKMQLSTTDQAIMVYIAGVYMNDLQVAKYRLDFPTAVQDVKSAALTSVYPNPARDRMFVTFSEGAGDGRSAELFDMLGKRVATWNFDKTTDKAEINLPSALASGQYTLAIRSGVSTKTEMLVIQ